MSGTWVSGRNSRQWVNMLDESQMRDDFQKRASMTQALKASSYVDLKSKSPQHPDAGVKPDSQSCQAADLCPEVKEAERILGEVAFQLDKRILTHVFPRQKRLYGFNLNNIQAKIIQVIILQDTAKQIIHVKDDLKSKNKPDKKPHKCCRDVSVSTHPLTGKVDETYRLQLCQRYLDLVEGLNQLGYNTAFHPLFSEFIVNNYGILKLKPDEYNPETLSCYSNSDFLKKVIVSTAPQEFQKDMLLLLSCLSYLAQKDGKLLFPL
ncbi:speriolin-like protein [Genypterus blacodes]|uniref:speriolin-like protein n=1 Tax=Genypterus blacodes TaxID=154954 RepID=UPI003F75F003